MAWCVCVCGHHRSDHPYVGYRYGTRSGYGGCGQCKVCQKPSSEHVYVAHQFRRCDCNEFVEVK